jgi:hypothetical protein
MRAGGLPGPDPGPVQRLHRRKANYDGSTAWCASTPRASGVTPAASPTRSLRLLRGRWGGKVTVTLEIEASLPDGVSDQIVRTVTENSRTLKFTSHGFESE